MSVQRILWVRDKDATSCWRCDQPFTMTLRRHHCRWCGGIFCAKCSSGSVEIGDAPSPQRLRVCAWCIAIAQSEASAAAAVRSWSVSAASWPGVIAQYQMAHIASLAAEWLAPPSGLRTGFARLKAHTNLVQLELHQHLLHALPGSLAKHGARSVPAGAWVCALAAAWQSWQARAMQRTPDVDGSKPATSAALDDWAKAAIARTPTSPAPAFAVGSLAAVLTPPAALACEATRVALPPLPPWIGYAAYP